MWNLNINKWNTVLRDLRFWRRYCRRDKTSIIWRRVVSGVSQGCADFIFKGQAVLGKDYAPSKCQKLPSDTLWHPIRPQSLVLHCENLLLAKWTVHVRGYEIVNRTDVAQSGFVPLIGSREHVSTFWPRPGFAWLSPFITAEARVRSQDTPYLWCTNWQLDNIFAEHLIEGSFISECDNEMIFSIGLIALKSV